MHEIISNKIMKQILLLVAVIILAGCSGQSARPQVSGGSSTIAVESQLVDSTVGSGLPLGGEKAPDFQYTMADGSVRKLSDLRGKKVLINFWATWCEPCRAEMADIQRIANERDDLVVLGVNKLEQIDVIVPFARELGVSFLLIANPKGDISERYGANNIPLSYFINSDGTVGVRQLGIMDYDKIQRRLSALQ